MSRNPLRASIRRRPLMTAGIVSALVLLTTIGVLALGWDLLLQGQWHQIDEAVYRAYNPAQASGSGTFDSFVRIADANSPAVEGYNTHYRPVQFQENTSPEFTHAYRLSNIPIVGDPDVPGVYREFQLDINQNAGQNISLDEVEIYLFYSTAADPESCGYPFDGTGGGHSGCPTTPSVDPNTVINVASLVYQLDKVGDAGDGNNWLRLNYDLAAGSGKRDMLLRVPNANFLANPLGQDPSCAYAGEAPAGSACNTWAVLYSHFGADEPGFINTDGFEEWGVELYDLATKAGVKFNDQNQNGVRDAGEPGLEGWTVYVDINNNGAMDLGEPYDVTDADGAYLIDAIVQGTYIVREVPQPDWTCSYPNLPGDLGTIPVVSSQCWYEETFAAGSNLTGNDFGNWTFTPGIAIDKTGDPLSKVGDDVSYTITVENTSTIGTPDLYCHITDALLGIDEYVWLAWNAPNHVINATYTVPPGAPDPLVNTASVSCAYSVDGAVAASDSDDHSVNLFQASVTIDKTGDTLSKVGDAVNYTITVDNTSSNDAPDLVCTVTDAMLGINQPVTLAWNAPNYVISASYTVPPGAPDPLVNTATVTCSPVGFPNVLTDSDDHSVDLVHPAFTLTKTCRAEPVVAGQNAIFDVVFMNTGDVNLVVTFDEGLAGPGCPAVAGTPVTVLASQSLTCQVTKAADADPGPSTVDNTVNAVVTLPASTGLDNRYIASASDSCDIYATKSGYKWHDMNRDGVWDAGEPPLPGWTIVLLGSDGSIAASSSTASDGKYMFDTVMPGAEYAVCEVVVPGWTQTYPTSGFMCPAGYGPRGYVINLTSGEGHTNNNFGNAAAGCAYTQGYWKNHADPNKHYDDTWDLLGPEGPNTMFFDSGMSWLEVFNTAPKGGNAWYILAHQYMAAHLNMLNGAWDGMAAQAIADAAALLDMYDGEGSGEPMIPKDSEDREAAIMLAETLDQFNNGYLGADHCDDE